MSGVLGALGILLGLPGAMSALHLTSLAVASLFFRPPAREGEPLSFLVVIPARNEQSVLRATLERMKEVARARDIILVVADRCTDSTAHIASQAGVEVLEYLGDHGSGRSAAIGAGIRSMGGATWDAVVTIDADSLVSPGFFEALEGAMAEGVAACQPRSEHTRGTNALSRLAEAAFALQGVTIPRGRDRLGISARLRGSGMTVRRDIVTDRPFTAHGVSEDLFYSMRLLLDGHRSRHVDGASLRSESAPTIEAGSGQRVRWEIGRLAAARAFLVPLLRKRNRSSFEAAIYLATPPIGIAVLSLVAGAGVAILASWIALAWFFLGGLLAIGFVVVVGLIQTKASWKTWMALVVAPWYVAWKGLIQVRAIARLGRANEAYEPTQRS